MFLLIVSPLCLSQFGFLRPAVVVLSGPQLLQNGRFGSSKSQSPGPDKKKNENAGNVSAVLAGTKYISHGREKVGEQFSTSGS